MVGRAGKKGGGNHDVGRRKARDSGHLSKEKKESLTSSKTEPKHSKSSNPMHGKQTQKGTRNTHTIQVPGARGRGSPNYHPIKGRSRL
nr:hypothetical protein Iba_scaffold35573CG0010 [Ipomoea batatas]